MKLLPRRPIGGGGSGKQAPGGPICNSLRSVVHRRRHRADSGLSTLFSDDDDDDDASLCSQTAGLAPRFDGNLFSRTPIHSSPTLVVGSVAGASSSSLKSSITSDASGSSASTRALSKKSVRFGRVQIREYATIIGSGCLSTSAGPPLGLDWAHDGAATVESDLDAYEVQRDADGPRLRATALRIPPGERVEMLLNCGVSPEEVQAAVKKVHEEFTASYSEYVIPGKYGLLLQEGGERIRMGVRSVASPIHSYIKRPRVPQRRMRK